LSSKQSDLDGKFNIINYTNDKSNKINLIKKGYLPNSKNQHRYDWSLAEVITV
jgi:hypothetical protein